MAPPRPPAPPPLLMSTSRDSRDSINTNDNKPNTATALARLRVGKVLKRLKKPLRNGVRRRRSSKASSDAASDALSSLGSGSFSEESSLTSGMERSLTIQSASMYDEDDGDLLGAEGMYEVSGDGGAPHKDKNRVMVVYNN